ncbi:NAD(P)-dependent dehydrogenase (short-subunit alcohol dehydrogenase family) [Sphingobacterium allocomposti]|uniref:NAD(P)-dependent dehydrogenase (Short-subunit alcohol dehydrogenase family) n=1 Tax=Sphingobacterium allocomposti TaxID=415956 RepID=A0A5S5CVC7_9SPHI|nr:SDR family NAD(P)-dependent oxidoreductase [Sphingobacterium composti Yoo et al. 2007 non Ten et al. 2007]TYP87737.1 NAD(P)-dependent dehydrogenase (short-subunit alcohol dehydrogenase family) [Sphingobacterium composti Yoo et al. 2007 non Ten et al. 2007]
MKTVLITGANKGIGFETARQLLQKGFYVFIGSRNPENGAEAVKKLNAEGLTRAEAVHLDVTDSISVQKAREEISKKTKALDILINNAGINGGSEPYTVLEATADEYLDALKTNAVGVARVTQAFIDLLRNAPEPRIVNVSTSVGSLSLQSNPEWPAYHYAKYGVYAISKAALNMYTVQLAYELRDTAFKVNAVCPGLTKTDLTFFNGGEVSVAANRIIKYALIDKDGPTGKFFSEETNPATGEIAW